MINMMFIDFWYLLILSWYFNQIWPSEFGTHKPWYFIFLPSYWSKKFCRSTSSVPYRRVSNNKNRENEIELPERSADGGEPINDSLQFMEPVAANFKAQIENKTCVDIQRLSKHFSTGDGIKVAVDELSLTMYSGQITALLG
jgi:ATP-binding cassette, subfamily A (ABC1), member 3